MGPVQQTSTGFVHHLAFPAKVLTSVNYSCLDLCCVTGGLSMNVLNSILENILILSPFIPTIHVIELIYLNISSALIICLTTLSADRTRNALINE